MAEEAMQAIEEEDEGTEVELPESETEETEPEAKAEKEEVTKSGQEDEIEDYSEGVKKRINKLTYKVRESERREQAAIEYAQSVQDELNKTKNKLSKTDKNLYDEYSTRVSSELNSAQERYKKAYESGDTDALLESQKDLAKLAVEEESLKRVKPEAETETEVTQGEQQVAPKWTQPAQQQQQAPQPDPKAKAWAEKNEWFGDDLAMTTAAFAFHRQLTEGEGYDPTSDEYYKEVDKRLAESFPHKLGNTQKEVRETVAGSSKGVGTTKARSRRTIKLTPSQVAIAKRLGVPLEEYAKHIKE
jgi:hypothetical protein|tara:strand:+ start:400 stop:1305 length:906 start_codon:yes stop_codon:yes gene_type:complete